MPWLVLLMVQQCRSMLHTADPPANVDRRTPNVGTRKQYEAQQHSGRLTEIPNRRAHPLIRISMPKCREHHEVVDRRVSRHPRCFGKSLASPLTKKRLEQHAQPKTQLIVATAAESVEASRTERIPRYKKLQEVVENFVLGVVQRTLPLPPGEGFETRPRADYQNA